MDTPTRSDQRESVPEYDGDGPENRHQPGWSGKGDDVGESVRRVTETLKEKSSEGMRKARETINQKGRQFASGGKRDAAILLSHLGSALRCAAEDLRDHDERVLSRNADALGDWSERCANYIQSREYGEIRREAEAVVRRYPRLFGLGLFACGLVAGRLMKACPPSGDFEEREPARGGPSPHHTPLADHPASPGAIPSVPPISESATPPNAPPYQVP
jgi:hypothetical protein